jgi:general secretion pathway protein D
MTANFPSPGLVTSPQAGTAFTTTLDLAHGFKPVITALSTFGTVRSLSSPRVTVVNNQSAVVNVAKDLVYFSTQVTVTPSTAQGVPPTTSFNTTQQSVPDGVLLNVTPTANPDTGDIILTLRPTVSKQVGTVTDPVIALNVVGEGGAQGLNNYTQLTQLDPSIGQVPEMFVQEIDSTLKMQSGQTMIMGGLMKDGNTVNQAGVPVLGDIPGIGAIFHSHGDNVTKSELVIFLQASIVPGTNVQDVDRKLYKEFGNDTRPFSM